MLNSGQLHNSNTSGPRLLTVAEVATLLRCSTKTIYRRVPNGTLPAIEEGGRFLFNIDDIRAVLIAKMVRPKSQPAGSVFDHQKVSSSSGAALHKTQLNT